MLNDEKQTVQQHRGKVIIVNFWATWCAPCRAEMPVLHRVQKDLQEKGLETFGVLAFDLPPKERIQRMSVKLSYKLAMKSEGALNPIRNRIPTTILIDRKGVVRHAILGVFEENDLRKKLIKLLNEAP
jgi:cytochrome c biogenesis protein CcmG, thiol:disulfide interchange protein DsbE